MTKHDTKDKKHDHGEKNEKELERLQKEVEEFENKYKRALADYQNLEKRVQEERRDWAKLSNRELLLRLLPILDTLILANIHTQHDGLKVSISQFLDVLKAEGVTKIETAGKVFDPKFMEAVMTENGEEGKVLEEVRIGFMLHDTLLRPAQVIVGKKVEHN